MESLESKPQPYISVVGYSCQTLIAREVNDFLHAGVFHCWFSVQFNPLTGGNSSNPCWLYQTLSKAVATDDTNDAKIKDIRTTLMDAVSRDLQKRGAATSTINNTIVKIRRASIEWFRPQVWRIFLERVDGRVSSRYQYPEERKIEDLKIQEFDIIVP